jgi:amino acid transporter
VLVGKVAGEAGMFTPVAFLFASALAGFSAFSYAELAARFPRSAGEAIYIEEAFAIKNFSLLVGLMIVSVGIISVATLAHGFAGYLNVYFDLPKSWIIVFIISAIGLVCAWGIAQSVIIASVLTIVEVFGLLLILYVGRESFVLIPLKMPEMLPDFTTSTWTGIFMGAFIAFYAYLGFEDIVNVAEEAVQPGINIPRAILISLIVTTIFYILVSVISILSLRPEMLSSSDAPLAMLYEYKTGSSPVVITLISLVSIINGALVQVIMASRVIYGMSQNKWLPEKLGLVSPLTHTPLIATWIVTGLVLVFALLLPILSLAKLTSFITLIIFMLINFALIKIKHSQKDYFGFTVPVWVPWFGGITTTLFLFQLISALLL